MIPAQRLYSMKGLQLESTRSLTLESCAVGISFCFGVFSLSLLLSLLPLFLLRLSISLSSGLLSSLSSLLVVPTFSSPQWPVLPAGDTGGWHQGILPCQHTRTLEPSSSGCTRCGRHGVGEKVVNQGVTQGKAEHLTSSWRAGP